MAKVPELSAVAKEVFEVLKSATAPMTFAEVKEIVPNAATAHFTALKNREMVNFKEVEKEVVTVVKRKVLEYTVPTEVE